MRYRREGQLPFIKLSAHPLASGGKFLVPNATNIFLAFHLLSSAALSVFAFLWVSTIRCAISISELSNLHSHVLQYSGDGSSEPVWMDMCWQVFVWLGKLRLRQYAIAIANVLHSPQHRTLAS